MSSILIVKYDVNYLLRMKGWELKTMKIFEQADSRTDPGLGFC